MEDQALKDLRVIKVRDGESVKYLSHLNIHDGEAYSYELTEKLDKVIVLSDLKECSEAVELLQAKLGFPKVGVSAEPLHKIFEKNQFMIQKSRSIPTNREVLAVGGGGSTAAALSKAFQ